jgi:hypothetical protein
MDLNSGPAVHEGELVGSKLLVAKVGPDEVNICEQSLGKFRIAYPKFPPTNVRFVRKPPLPFSM